MGTFWMRVATQQPTAAALCAGRVVIVTGAAGGIGREYTLHLAREGARVVVNDLGVWREGMGCDLILNRVGKFKDHQRVQCSAWLLQ